MYKAPRWSSVARGPEVQQQAALRHAAERAQGSLAQSQRFLVVFPYSVESRRAERLTIGSAGAAESGQE